MSEKQQELQEDSIEKDENMEQNFENSGWKPALEVKGLDFVEDEELIDELANSQVENKEPLMQEIEGSELSTFESVEIEDREFIEKRKLFSILESILFSTDRPITLEALKQVFKGTSVTASQLKDAMDEYAVELASPSRGVSLELVAGGYQIRTKVDNIEYLKRMQKNRPFRLSQPAMEVLSIIAYKQPCIKSEVDEIRGVESGHLMRALMDKGLMRFAGKSELPGKPMLYETTKKFLEIFGLRNIKELPTLNEIDELIPEGIGEIEEEQEKLNALSDKLSMEAGQSYSENEEELGRISEQLSGISTTTDFFEKEKIRQREERDKVKAEDIREAVLVGEQVDPAELEWLSRYDKRTNCVT